MTPTKRQAPSHRLEIHLLGSFRLVYDDRVLPAFPTRSAKLLFSYLVLHRGRSHSRETLAALCWGDRDEREARRRLRTELFRVRRTLAKGTKFDGYLEVEQNWVGFDDRNPFWLDVDAFERRVRAADKLARDDPQAEPLLEEAASLYEGELLEGEYEAWCLIEQDRLRALRLEVLERLLGLHIRRGRWRRALRCGRELLRHDPLVEHVHRRIMALYYLSGDRPRALRQFKTCKTVLSRELDVDPMRRTIELHDALRTEDVAKLEALIPFTARKRRRPADAADADAPAAAGDADSPAAGEAISHLEEAADGLVRAQRELLRGIETLAGRPRRPRRDPRPPSPPTRSGSARLD